MNNSVAVQLLSNLVDSTLDATILSKGYDFDQTDDEIKIRQNEITEFKNYFEKMTKLFENKIIEGDVMIQTKKVIENM